MWSTFFFLLFKDWIINTKCSGFSCSNKWESWARRGWITIMPSQSSLQKCALCNMFNYTLKSEELNQELASHGARGQWPPLLSEERQILLLKIFNLAIEQLTGRMRTWPDCNSCHGRWTRISFVFIRVWQYTRVSGSDNTEKHWSFFLSVWFTSLYQREKNW